MLVASLKQTVARQSQEIEGLQNKLKEASSRDDEVSSGDNMTIIGVHELMTMIDRRFTTSSHFAVI
jgi:hypothetical protein